MTDNIIIRLLVAIVAAAVVVWLLGLTALPSIIVGVVALVVFFGILFGAL